MKFYSDRRGPYSLQHVLHRAFAVYARMLEHSYAGNPSNDLPPTQGPSHSWASVVKGMGIDEVLTVPHSQWQNPFAERLIGSVRRECLNHTVVLGEWHLRRILTAYFAYYHRARTHLSLDKDAPDVRRVELPAAGRIVQIPEVSGLHHRHVRRAA